MKITLLGYEVYCGRISEIILSMLASNKLSVVNTINPHSYVVAKKNPGFMSALKNSEFLIPDGAGVVVAARIIQKQAIARVSGYDFFSETMSCLNEVEGRVFFLGSTQTVLNLLSKRVQKNYPKVSVGFLSPSFKAQFSSSDIEYFREKVNTFNPDVLFVGLTAPKQELLIEQLRDNLNVNIVSGIGAVFDFYAGTIRRPSDFWIRLNLEWLVRFLGEPRRLWRRNFISTPIFIFDVFSARFLKRRR